MPHVASGPCRRCPPEPQTSDAQEPSPSNARAVQGASDHRQLLQNCRAQLRRRPSAAAAQGYESSTQDPRITQSTVADIVRVHDQIPAAQMASSNPNTGTAAQQSNTSKFPAFLEYDPFANDRFNSGRSAGVLSVTGPVGEPGLPPSRPTSVDSSAVAASSVAGDRLSIPPRSRRGIANFATNKSFRDSRETDSSDLRPITAASNRTHVPSILSQGFFRPISSQKLQAQRNQWPATGSTQASTANKAERGRPSIDQQTVRSHRYSDASVNTLRDGRPSTHDERVAPPLPTSRGTLSTHDGSAAADGMTAASMKTYGSQTPLHSRLQPVDTQSSNRFYNGAQNSDKRARSPRSVRASLRLGSRASRQNSDQRLNGHGEKSGSHPSTPNENEKPLAMAETFKPRRENGRNYEYFAGNTLFICSGHLLNTKAWPLNLLTFGLTALPAALFFAFSAPWLWFNVSPAIPIVFAYIVYLALASFLHAAFSDPGILPRNLHPHPPNPEEERDPLTVGPPTTEWVMVKTFPSASRAPLPGRANSSPEEDGAASDQMTAMEVPTKYCKTCNIWRPPRGHHCRVCDACVDTQDHHCVWLNNCIGRRNYRYFFSYVGLAFTLALLLIAFSLTHIILYGQQHHISFSESLTGRTQERVAFAMFIYAIVAMPYPGSLFFYHIWLSSRGETTRESLNSHKFPQKDRHRPFTQSSFLRNLISVLARPRPPSYMQFAAHYETGDSRLGHVMRKKDRQRDLRNRFSVERGNGPVDRSKNNNNNNNINHSNNGDRVVEMEKLPPTSMTTDDTSRQHQTQTQMSTRQSPISTSPQGLSWPLNSTPR